MIVPTGGTAAGGGRSRTSARSSTYPSKIYLPRNPLEVVLAMQEARALKQPLAVRGPGDDVDDALEGPVLSVARLDRILGLDRAARTVTVEPGVSVADLEAFLAGEGLALKVSCGDAGRVVGSFAASLGVGPSSHHHGLFADQVVALEQVSRDGSSQRHRRDREGCTEIVRRLTSGRDVTVNLTLDVVVRDKRHALVRQQVQRFASLREFIAASAEHMRTEQGALLKFSRLVDLAPGTPSRVLGVVVSAYEAKAPLEGATRMLARGQAALGRRTSRWSLSGQRATRSALSVCERRYATYAEVEAQSWRARSAGDGARVHHVLAAEERYEALTIALHRLCASHWRSGTIDAVGINLTGVRSASLGAFEGRVHCELRLEVVPGPSDGQPARRDFAAALRSICSEHGATQLSLPAWRADERPS
jgi:FAD/FMN-containing dehydrogenase